MVPGKMGLLVGAMLLCFARSVHAVALGADCTSAACDDLTAMVCDPSDNKCKVQADETQTDCNSDDTLCPENAACSTTTCSCSAGFIEDGGLCTVQDADCSSDACGDLTNYVCDPDATDTCKVKADGVKTDCSSTDGNCATHATCAGDGTCSCNTGYTDLATGLCTAIIGFTCSVNGDCTALDANTECNSLACACKLGYKGAAGDTCAAIIGSTCENDAACSSALANSECVKTYPCTKGRCACSSGYSGMDCLTLGYQKTCDTNDDQCNVGENLECPSGGTKCDCKSGFSYKSALGFCIDQPLLGESCTGSGTGNCYTTANSECDSTDSKCKCSSGYYQDGQFCRQPYGGETCTQGDTCVVVDTTSILSGGESSQQAPTCTSSKCDCGSNEKVKRKIGSTCYTVCLSSGTGQTAVGQTCSAFSDCASRVCAQCPDDANPKCYNAPCSGSTVVSGSILVSSIILLSILF